MYQSYATLFWRLSTLNAICGLFWRCISGPIILYRWQCISVHSRHKFYPKYKYLHEIRSVQSKLVCQSYATLFWSLDFECPYFETNERAVMYHDVDNSFLCISLIILIPKEAIWRGANKSEYYNLYFLTGTKSNLWTLNAICTLFWR